MSGLRVIRGALDNNRRWNLIKLSLSKLRRWHEPYQQVVCIDRERGKKSIRHFPESYAGAIAELRSRLRWRSVETYRSNIASHCVSMARTRMFLSPIFAGGKQYGLKDTRSTSHTGGLHNSLCCSRASFRKALLASKQKTQQQIFNEPSKRNGFSIQKAKRNFLIFYIGKFRWSHFDGSTHSPLCCTFIFLLTIR